MHIDHVDSRMIRNVIVVTLSTFLVVTNSAIGRGTARPQSNRYPFTGTWVADLESQSGLGKDVYLVADGKYRCDSCTPPRSYPADGKFRSIGDSEGTHESVSIAGARSIVTRIVEPAISRVTTMTVSPDNRTATYTSIDHRPGIRQALKTVYLARRVAPGPKGSHPVSGTWQGVRYVSVPELIRTTVLRESSIGLTYRSPVGSSYSAQFGGAFVQVKGPYKGKVLASVKRVGERKIIETRTEDGKIILVRAFSLSPDGRTLTITSDNPATNSSFVITSRKK
jgi:hypothetical protein